MTTAPRRRVRRTGGGCAPGDCWARRCAALNSAVPGPSCGAQRHRSAARRLCAPAPPRSHGCTGRKFTPAAHPARAPALLPYPARGVAQLRGSFLPRHSGACMIRSSLRVPVPAAAHLRHPVALPPRAGCAPFNAAPRGADRTQQGAALSVAARRSGCAPRAAGACVPPAPHRHPPALRRAGARPRRCWGAAAPTRLGAWRAPGCCGASARRHRGRRRDRGYQRRARGAPPP